MEKLNEEIIVKEEEYQKLSDEHNKKEQLIKVMINIGFDYGFSFVEIRNIIKDFYKKTNAIDNAIAEKFKKVEE